MSLAASDDAVRAGGGGFCFFIFKDTERAPSFTRHRSKTLSRVTVCSNNVMLMLIIFSFVDVYGA